MNPFLAAIYASARRELRHARYYQGLADEYAMLIDDGDLDMRRRRRDALDTRDHYVRRAQAYRKNAAAFRAQCAAIATEDTLPPQPGAAA